MEILLNIIWAICSLALIGFWITRGTSERTSRTAQLLALGIVLLLLLPVISLSDDLLAMQGPAETDSCLRRVQHSNPIHPASDPVLPALPVELASLDSLGVSVTGLPRSEKPASPSSAFLSSVESRPPPRA